MQENNNQNIEQQPEQNTFEKKEKNAFTKALLEQVELVVIFFAVMILIFSFTCRTCKVDGDSMLNTLHNEETVLIWDLFYKPNYGDIVVVHDNNQLNKPIVKRVIALSGDTVKIEHYLTSMKVTVQHSDGTVDILDEDYIRYDASSGGLSYYTAAQTYVVEEGEVFVMGDNRLDSLDSRLLGCYDTRQILGKVVFRLMPFNKIGTVN